MSKQNATEAGTDTAKGSLFSLDEDF